MSIGCNASPDVQMKNVKEILHSHFPDIMFTDMIVSAAYGQSSTAAQYANMMATCTTVMPMEKLVACLKSIEIAAGNTKEFRSQGVVMMDIDLMQYDAVRCHADDWERPYIRRLYALLKKMLCVCLSFVICSVMYAQSVSAAPKDNGSELLGKAVEYYIGGKYHECTLVFENLKRYYTLTPRFQAYLGFSYYKEGKYSEAIESLKSAIPHLSAFSPKEQSVYLYACAESLFSQYRYDEAVKYYDRLLPLTEGNDKGDVLFHKAFSIYLSKKMESIAGDSVRISELSPYVIESYDLFRSAARIYEENASTATSLQVARLRQCEAVVNGFKSNLLPFIQNNKTLLH